MSMILCDSCEALIDSDADPDCFFESPHHHLIGVFCEDCRERAWDLEQERRAEEAP